MLSSFGTRVKRVDVMSSLSAARDVVCAEPNSWRMVSIYSHELYDGGGSALHCSWKSSTNQ